MAHKLLEAHVSRDLAETAEATLSPLAERVWVEEGGRFDVLVRAVVGAERSGTAVDQLHDEITG